MTDFVKFPLDKFERDAFDRFSATSNFDLGTARALMWVSQLVYQAEDLHALANVVRDAWGFQSMDSFVRGDLQRVTTGVIGERADAVVLAFAGTDPGILQTLLTDANAKRDANDIHVGFDEASVVAKENTLKAAQQAMRANKPLFIAGHSLGGALSALAARECLAVQAPRAIYTFGMPRVGGETFAKSYNESVLGPVTYRLVHGDDMVPRVPLSDWGYRHVGRLLQCITDGKFDPAAALSPLPSDDPTLAASLLPAINNYVANVFSLKILGRPGPMPGLLGESFRFLAPPIRHHLQDYYIDALRP